MGQIQEKQQNFVKMFGFLSAISVLSHISSMFLFAVLLERIIVINKLLKDTVCKISMDTIFLCPFNQLSILPYEIKWLIFYFFWKSNLSCQPSRVTNQPLFVIKQLFIKRVSTAIINLRIAHFNKTLLCISLLVFVGTMPSNFCNFFLIHRGTALSFHKL